MNGKKHNLAVALPHIAFQLFNQHFPSAEYESLRLLRLLRPLWYRRKGRGCPPEKRWLQVSVAVLVNVIVTVVQSGAAVWRFVGCLCVDGMAVVVAHHSLVAAGHVAAGAGFCVKNCCADCVASVVALRR